MIKNDKYYSRRFGQVPHSVIKCQYKRNRWVLRLLDKQLKNPKDCGIGFFHFLVAKCLEIGEQPITQVVGSGVPLYQFLQEHEIRKNALKER